MLQSSASNSREPSQPPSPRRRIAHPVRGPREEGTLHPPAGTEFIGSEPRSPSRASKISSSAFTQGYFKTFFVEERELGRGGKGVVLLVRHLLDGVSLGHFACKRVPVGDDHVWLEKVLVEVQLLQNLAHQNLVSYRHVWLEDCQITNFGPSVPCAFILQQYCNGGDLHNYVLGPGQIKISNEDLKERMRRRSKGQADRPDSLQASRRMGFDEIFSFFKDITSGLHHLHSHGYIHRDLKPSNCLLHRDNNQRYRVLVSDFGEVQMENVARQSTGATGTISYCAPEVLMKTEAGGFGNFTTKSDVFSLGMIVYFMCFGKLPYSNADDINEEQEDVDLLRAEISTWAGFDDERQIRADLPDKLYKFLKRLLSLNPNDRPSTEEMLQGIRAGATLEELDHDERPTFLNDLRHRISVVDSPSPTPRRMSNYTAPAVPHFQRPPSALRHSSTDTGAGKRSPPLAPEILEERAGSPIRESVSPRRSISPMKPRLALPPPPPPYSRIQSYISQPAVSMAIRIFLFLIKYLTLTQPCSPYEASSKFVFPLMALALSDFLGVGHQGLGVRRAVLLMTAHLILVFVAGRTGKLCPRKLGGWGEDGI